MADKKTTPPKKNSNKNNLPKFNFYWIYGVAIAAIIGFSLFGNTPQGKAIIDNYKFQEMAQNGDVEKITYIKNTGKAEVRLKATAIENDDKYKAFRKPTMFNRTSPHYVFDA